MIQIHTLKNQRNPHNKAVFFHQYSEKEKLVWTLWRQNKFLQNWFDIKTFSIFLWTYYKKLEFETLCDLLCTGILLFYPISLQYTPIYYLRKTLVLRFQPLPPPQLSDQHHEHCRKKCDDNMSLQNYLFLFEEKK